MWFITKLFYMRILCLLHSMVGILISNMLKYTHLHTYAIFKLIINLNILVKVLFRAKNGDTPAHQYFKIIYLHNNFTILYTTDLYTVR